MKNQAILNFRINVGDWSKGPFSNIGSLQLAYEKIADIKPFLGDFIMLNSGELKRGHEKGLCTRIGVIDAEGFRNHHIHWNSKGTITYLSKQGKKIVTEHYPQKSFDLSPCYTLEGLYEMLPNQAYGRKMNAMITELVKHDCSEELENFDNSLVKNERLKLKLLEHLYKKCIY